MQLARREILNGLQRKGFILHPRGGDHIHLVYYDSQGRKTQANTKMSRGTKHRSVGRVLIGNADFHCLRIAERARLLIVARRGTGPEAGGACSAAPPGPRVATASYSS